MKSSEIGGKTAGNDGCERVSLRVFPGCGFCLKQNTGKDREMRVP